MNPGRQSRGFLKEGSITELRQDAKYPSEKWWGMPATRLDFGVKNPWIVRLGLRIATISTFGGRKGMKVKHPLLLVILDGWGHSEDYEHNAIAQAKTPCWDELWQHCPHALLQGSGEAVGLPHGQMGNSEVGHLNMGAGRQVAQDLLRINQAIHSGEFDHNLVLNQLFDDLLVQDKALHMMGLLSAGGVHSHEQHWYALLQLAARKGLQKVYLHLFLDGRDCAPKSAEASILRLQEQIEVTGCGQIVSLTGRYYAMDRDERWDRVQQAYDVISCGVAKFSATEALLGLQAAYARGETDEFVQAVSIHAADQARVQMQTDDAVLFVNFRADRARQLTRALTCKDFSGFARAKLPKLSRLVTMTHYADDIEAMSVFAPLSLKNGLGETIANAGLHQLRIAETEKYAHVTFFFNGGVEQSYAHEDRILIPSPKVATYDLQPAMSAALVTDQLVQVMQSQAYDVMICNFANADMVGHSGNFSATVQAIEALDACLQRLVVCCQAQGVELMITADHGNAEAMYDEHQQEVITAHSSNPVPFVYKGRTVVQFAKQGTLADIAPTMLVALGLPVPKEMTGRILLKLEDN